FEKNPELVLDFYNKRRRQLKGVHPNAAHLALKELEDKYEVTIITQNVDDLHERAGSEKVIHLHGELFKVRSTFDKELIFDWKDDLNVGDFCEFNSQLRPHIVWFGEEVPLLETAALKVEKADILIIIGTSMQVYPAAGLKDFAPPHCQMYFIDPKPAISEHKNLSIIAEKASTGVKKLVEELLKA
ncbi:MAG: SIR2 family NAD-dependent protein deacylase, partial [Mesonia sp.]